MDLHNIRKDYKKECLMEDSVSVNPHQQFENWISEAIDGDVVEPTAMTLSTVSKDGMPSSRIVLLKGFSEDNGYRFFTNYKSRKGKDLENTFKASLLFFWPELERQVRIEGVVGRLKPEESDSYFKSRPMESQINASISKQSRVISSREELELMRQLKIDSGADVQRPKSWGGYSLYPHYFEFWQGGVHRLHDRISYKKSYGTWSIDRLAP